MERVRRAGVAVAASLVLVGIGVPPVAPADVERSAGWTVDAAPFRLTFVDHGRPLLAQAGGEIAGPGGRMAYALADGGTHRLTDLLRTEHGRGAVTYVVSTDE